MKVFKKTISILDRTEDIVMFLLCLFLFLIGLYAMYDSYLIFQGANDTSLLKYKPGYSNEVDQGDILDSMVSWLTIDGTQIDYPVMQGKDNVEFLNKNPYGAYSLSGSLFLDCRNSSDFSDGYSLIYGHHMEGGAMFGALDEYLDEEYFLTHEKGEIIVGDTEYDYLLYAVIEADARDEMVFAPTEVPAEDTVDYVREKCMYYDPENAPEDGEKVVAMSTCKYPDTNDRTLVFGKIVNPHPLETETEEK